MSDKIATFDGDMPGNYDHYLGPILFEPYADDLSRRVAAAAGVKDVLELACGTGILTRRLLDKLAPAAHIVATDLSEDMLEFARRKIGPTERVEWRHADAMELPFASASFDAVVCQFGWMFMPDKTVAAREALRVLRPGGAFLFNVWDSLTQNDLPRIVQAVLEERFPSAPPQFLPFAFGYHDRHIITTALATAGFPDVSIAEVTQRGTTSSVRQAATGLLTGTPLRYALQQRGINNPSELIDASAARSAKEGGNPPDATRLLALVVTAKA